MSFLKRVLEERKKNLPSSVFFSQVKLEKSPVAMEKVLKKNQNRLSLIAELKRQSPSRGSIKPTATVQEMLRVYEKYAKAISVLTEPQFFRGSLEDLREMRKLTQIPLLRKDFIIDPIQVLESRYYGANSYLLIVAALSLDQLKELLAVGREWGMEPLVEVQTEKELELALSLDIKILGVNNRNLHDLSLDLSTVPTLFAKIPKHKKENLVLVAESGYFSRKDIENLPPETDAVLIGTSLMEAEDPEKLLQEMFS